MTALQSGAVRITATATDPIHHGAGTDGNRQILRKQKLIHPNTGAHCRVPFISGNSIKHKIRANAARFALHAMGVEPGSMTKGQIHLLFSGGALSGGGATIKLAKVRELQELFPVLSLCGYSASNNMTASRVSVDNLHLVCAENDWRLPESLREHPNAKLRVGEQIDDAFGTRHEPTRADHTARRLLSTGDAAKDLEALEEAAAKASKGEMSARASDSAQMIYTFEVIKPGSVWWGGLYFDELTTHELAALKSGLAYSTRGRDADDGLVLHLGAKSSVGYGRMSASLAGAIRRVEAPVYEPDNALVPAGREAQGDDVEGYVDHLRTNRDAILKALKEAAK